MSASSDFTLCHESPARKLAAQQRTAPDLSIVVPIYNTAPYLEECLSSLLAQKGCSFELVLIDDGSEDNSLSLAEKIVQDYPSINCLLLTQKNKGLSAVRNLGLRLACGEYIAFLDSDYLMMPDAYRRMLKLGREKKCEIVFCKSFEYDQTTRKNRPFYDEWIWNSLLPDGHDKVSDSKQDPHILILETNANPKIMRLDFARSIGLSFPEGKYFEDLPAHLLSILSAKKIGLVNYRGYGYRVGRNGKITTARSRQRFDVLDSMDMALRQTKPLIATAAQGSRVMYSLLRIVDWCGTMAPLEDRPAFYKRAAEQFSKLPKAWLTVFEKEFIVSFHRQITVLALFYRHVSLAVNFAAAKRTAPQLLWLFLRHGRLRTLAYHRKEIFKKKNDYTPAPKPSLESTEGLFNKIAATLSHQTPKDSFARDFDRCTGFLGGRELLCLPPDAAVLDVQSDSELLSFQLACWDRERPIYIVNPDEARRGLLSRIAKENGLDAVTFFADLESAIDLISSRHDSLGLLKIDADRLEEETLTYLCDRFKIERAYGSYSTQKISALALFRLCQNRINTFFWRYAHSEQEIDHIAGMLDLRPEVSIVVPAFGVESCLDRCLDSLISQTIASKEIIVVDDGATDRSGEIADAWQAHYPSIITVIHQANGGCASARSAGLAAAKGQFVGFVDGDDWAEPPMFERLYEAAALLRTDISQCGFKKVYELDNVQENIVENHTGNTLEATSCPASLIKFTLSLLATQPTIWRRLYRTEFLRRNHIDFPHQILRFDDLPFQFSSFLAATRVSVIPGHYYAYRLQRVGQDVAATDDRLFVHFDIFTLLKHEIAQRGSYLSEMRLKRTQLNSHEWALSRIEPAYREAYYKRMGPDLFKKNSFMNACDVLVLAWSCPRHLFRLALKAYQKLLFSAVRSD